MMDEKKIAFIVCTNNNQWYSECARYIERLEVPTGMEVEIVPIIGAKSMTAGYNEGMMRSNAKYKVYLHQDTFIVRRDFIQRVVNILSAHPEVGIMGVLGTDGFVQNASYWDYWDLGQVYAFTVKEGYELYLSKGGVDEIIYGEALDGMLLITQYDIKWREDIFQEWDFYDVSQCFEFRKNGYNVAIMCEEEISCLHDCGYSKMARYDYNREIFTKEYAEFGFEYSAICLEVMPEELQILVNEFLQSLDKILLINVEQACQIIEEVYTHCSKDNRMATLKVLRDIYIKERVENVQKLFIGTNCGWESLVEKYTKYKFLIRQIEFDISKEAVDEIVSAIITEEISIIAIREIVTHCCIKGKKVVDKINNHLDKATVIKL